MSGQFILVCSYPKSGNTWVRVVLDRLRRGPGVSINALDDCFTGLSRRVFFDAHAPACSSDLTPEETETLISGVFSKFADQKIGFTVVKSHERALRADGLWLYPPEIVSSVIYIVRHPFDVAVSAAHHFGIDVPGAVDMMAGAAYLRAPLSFLPEGLPLRYGTWSENVTSWLDAEPYHLAVARYEDLHEDSLSQFMRISKVAGLDVSAEQVSLIVKSADFENLKLEEERDGFREKLMNKKPFFRSGRPRSWEGLLDEQSRQRLLDDHGAVMERLGYRSDGSVAALVE